MDNQKIKTSIIGTGHLGTIHCRLLKKNPLAEFVGIYDKDDEKAKQISQELNIKKFNTIEELLQYSEAVFIVVPTTLHFEIAKKCLEHDKHCFIEKPVTSTTQQAKELLNIEKNKPYLTIQVGHIERFNPTIETLIKNPISPLFIESHRLSQFKLRAIDVSVIHDLMIHDIDLVLWLVNSPIKSIDANGVKVVTNTIDIANARIKFENGTVANLTSSRISAKPMRKMRFFQKSGYFSLDFTTPSIEIFKLTKELPSTSNTENIATMLGGIEELKLNKHIIFEKPRITPSNAIQEEQTSFLTSIINKKVPMVSLIEGYRALEVAEEISNQINNSCQ